jgi:diguanylate cyclase (GGDEF)-like protein
MSAQPLTPTPGGAPAHVPATDNAQDAAAAWPDLCRLGEALGARCEQIVARVVERTRESGGTLDVLVEESFERVGVVSTVAVARWMAGESKETAREVGQETSLIFGQLAAQRAAPLKEVTKRCLRWGDAAAQALRESAQELELSQQVLGVSLMMLQQSLNVTLVRMCEAFDAERARSDVELEHRQQELAFMATHDGLTGLPNRTLIMDRLEQMLVRARHQRTAVAALFIDLDNFKSINDTLGHAAGDELLQAVAARLDAVVRDVDALGRLGGDEFVVVATDMSRGAGPELVAERLLEALKEPFPLGEDKTPISVTASIGIASGEEIAAAELLQDADIALYRAKLDGRNRYAVFEDGMQASAQRRLALEMDLRVALANDELFLEYQPTFDLEDMHLTGIEALVRWQSPSRGVVQPNDFIPILEDTGLIVDVGRWVLERACLQAAVWRAAGYPIRIAVNVSARQLDGDGILADVQRALALSSLAPSALTIEITETTLMRNVEETAARLSAIKQLGVRVAIDDFGTGYSSLAHLRQFPVDALKIDRSFITGLANNHEGEMLIRTLVQLGKALSIETIAEGIERHDELSLLREERCDAGQGFLFARPLDAQTAEAFLRDCANSVEPLPVPPATAG